MISILALIMFASTHLHIFLLLFELSFHWHLLCYLHQNLWRLTDCETLFSFLVGQTILRWFWESFGGPIMIIHYFSKCYNIFCQIFGLVYAFFSWCVLMFLFVFNVVWRKELSTWNCCNSSRSFHVKFYFAEYVVWLFWYILDGGGSIRFWISY